MRNNRLIVALLIFDLFLRLPETLTKTREFLQPSSCWSSNQATAKLVVRTNNTIPSASKGSNSTSVKEMYQALSLNDINSSLQPDTTIVITSSLIPTHPSLSIINRTITSTRERLLGLHPETPIIIAVDGLKPGVSKDEEWRHQTMVEYLQSNYTRALILTKNASEGLTKNIYSAIMDHVQTKFLYLLQHDLMFYKDINHTAMVKSFVEYPEILKVVRFNKRLNRLVGAEKQYASCWDTPSVLNSVNGIHFTKSGLWSDNNQFATKLYYQNLFQDPYIGPAQMFAPMEFRMRYITSQNCTEFGPWLYGRVQDDGPYIYHLDGRNAKSA